MPSARLNFTFIISKILCYSLRWYVGAIDLIRFMHMVESYFASRPGFSTVVLFILDPVCRSLCMDEHLTPFMMQSACCHQPRVTYGSTMCRRRYLKLIHRLLPKCYTHFLKCFFLALYIIVKSVSRIRASNSTCFIHRQNLLLLLKIDQVWP